jgi:hypothetical protein
MTTTTPVNVRRHRTMARLADADAQARWMRQRRRDAVRNGMNPRQPLTRQELAEQCARNAGR